MLWLRILSTAGIACFFFTFSITGTCSARYALLSLLPVALIARVLRVRKYRDRGRTDAGGAARTYLALHEEQAAPAGQAAAVPTWHVFACVAADIAICCGCIGPVAGTAWLAVAGGVGVGVHSYFSLFI